MKHLLKSAICLNSYFILSGMFGLLVYFSNKEEYTFGTEVAGFSYYSSTHHVLTHSFIICFGIFGLLIYKKSIKYRVYSLIWAVIGFVTFLFI